MTAISEYQLELLHHTLGLTPDRREPYRNYYHAGEGHYANEELKNMVAAGYVTANQAPAMWGDGIVYCATEYGKRLALELLPHPIVEKNESKRRYQDYIEYAECYDSFAAYLGIDVPERQYCNWGDDRGKVRLHSRKATGEYCKTLKEAKASYKSALKTSKTFLSGVPA